MKKLSILAFCLFVGVQLSAQNAKHYLGDYKVANAPFEKIIVSWENDKLYGNAVGQGKAELKASKTADTYEVIGYGGEVKFNRNENKQVTSLTLQVEGQEISASRVIPPLEDYEGKFIMADGPVSSMTLKVENGVVMASLPEVGKGPIAVTSIIDQFYGDEYNSDLIFTRNEDNIIDSVFILVQGTTIIGAKQMMNAKAENSFIGLYEFESSPIRELEVTAKEGGDLYGSSDQGEGIMKKTDKPDVFKIVDYDGEAVFKRNADGSVNGIILKIQGNEMMGSKRK